MEAKRESEDLKFAYLQTGLPASLAGLASRFSGNTCCCWGLEEWDRCVGEGKLEKKMYVIH